MRKLFRRLVALFAAAAAVVAGMWTFARQDQEPASAGLVVVAAAPAEVPGYDRSCEKGRGCAFGPAWTDDVDVDLGHDGCGTRDGILQRDLENVEFKPGTRGCVVVAGDLTDPYSGQEVRFTKSDAGQVQIDHVYPLAIAWDRGASTWSLQRRQNFANDPRNLLATTAATNQSKGARMPDEWLPSTAAGRCRYATQLVDVARAYRLAVTAAENTQLTKALGDCTAE